MGVLGRRGLLTGAAALGMFGTAQAAGKAFRIDVHHHITPPSWLAAVKKVGLDTPPMANWSVEKSLEDMEKGGIATAMTSPTTPQLGFLPAAEAATIARESNEYARKVANDHPGRFGLFAMLQMPHVDECMSWIGSSTIRLRWRMR